MHGSHSNDGDDEHRGAHRRHHGGFDSDAMIQHLEGEGRLAAPMLETAMEATGRWLTHVDLRPQRIVDLGCGPGLGTIQLAMHHPEAIVVGVDEAATMVGRAAGHVLERELDDRVELMQLDLNDDLSAIGSADLVVASMSLHHVADQQAVLRRMRALLDPAGVLCILERADPNSARLSSDLDRPGLWDRLDLAWRRWFDAKRHQLPGADEAGEIRARVEAAGFELLEVRSLVVNAEAGADPVAEQVARNLLRRAADDLDGFADPADLAALRSHLVELDGGSAAAMRPRVRLSRMLYIARPASA